MIVFFLARMLMVLLLYKNILSNNDWDSILVLGYNKLMNRHCWECYCLGEFINGLLTASHMLVEYCTTAFSFSQVCQKD